MCISKIGRQIRLKKRRSPVSCNAGLDLGWEPRCGPQRGTALTSVRLVHAKAGSRTQHWAGSGLPIAELRCFSWVAPPFARYSDEPQRPGLNSSPVFHFALFAPFSSTHSFDPSPSLSLNVAGIAAGHLVQYIAIFVVSPSKENDSKLRGLHLTKERVDSATLFCDGGLCFFIWKRAYFFKQGFLPHLFLNRYNLHAKTKFITHENTFTATSWRRCWIFCKVFDM